MAFQVSPGVNVTEIDLTTVVPAVSSTEGAIAGVFNWGPIEDRVLISSETQLVSRFGKPTSANFETFFAAANFLAYGNKLYVSRAADATAYNAGGSAAAGSITSTQIKNYDAFQDASLDVDATYWARYAGTLGNSLKVAVCDTANAFFANIDFSSATISFKAVPGSPNVDVTGIGAGDLDNLNVGDLIEIDSRLLKIKTKGSVTSNAATIVLTDSFTGVANAFANGTINRYWEFYGDVSAAPGTSAFVANAGGTSDELHVLVIDEDGLFTGTKGAILERYESLSRATDAKGPEGGSIFYRDVINESSQYIYVGSERAGSYEAAAASVAAFANTIPLSLSLAGGADSTAEGSISVASLSAAWDKFKNAEEVDVSLLIAGKAVGLNGVQIANYVIDNIAEYRKDCVVFISPRSSDVVNNVNAVSNAVTFRNNLRSTSYAVLDSGYKYQYDRYNDVNRYIPLCGDIAGLCVRTDETRDPWFSPAGFNRGQVKNILKLAYNPDKAQRDILYKNGINPVVTFPGQGTVLYGDKTLLSKPSAFDRINVRRLFIVLEKAIATSAKFSLFEFNDEFTRAQFRSLVEPYLRDIQGRRGIFDFKVVCDTTNNTGEVIDRNEFVGDIYIKPARSINFIQLNFIAVRTGVEFSEVIGQF
jgi:phage tail sheath protein FI